MLSTIVKAAVFARVALAQCPVGNPPIAVTTSASPTTSTVAIHPSSNSNLCLDVQANTRADGTPVQVYTCNGSGAQKWVIKNGAVQLAGTNYCLDAGSNAANGVKMKIWTCYAGITAQTWTQSGSAIKLSGPNQCLDLTDGKAANGNSVQTWACAGGNPNQAWSTTSLKRRSRSRSVVERASCKAPLTPNGKKAGLAGGNTFDDMKNYIGWWYDWTGVPSGHPGTPIAVPMLWGNGHRGSVQNDYNRFTQFTSSWSTSKVPQYVLGFNEPDCSTGESSDITVSAAASAWNQYISPLGNAGALLISPAMCMQQYESFITPFQQSINTPFDVIAVHIYKNTIAGVKTVLDYYWSKYQKPMWVTEFGCVNDVGGFVACSSQSVATQFMTDAVNLFQNDNRVYAYSPCDVGNAWTIGKAGQLTETGKAYLAAIKRF